MFEESSCHIPLTDELRRSYVNGKQDARAAEKGRDARGTALPTYWTIGSLVTVNCNRSQLKL